MNYFGWICKNISISSVGEQMKRTIKGKITVQTILYLLTALIICELVSVITLDSNMTSQSREYIDAEAQNNAAVVNEWLTE